MIDDEDEDEEGVGLNQRKSEKTSLVGNLDVFMNFV